MFFNRKPVENVPETFEARLRKLEIRMLKFDSELMDLAQSQDIIRNKVLRKIQERRKPEEEEQEEGFRGLPFTKDSNSQGFLKL